MTNHLRSHRSRILQVIAAVLLAVVLTGCLSSGQSSVAGELNHDRAVHGRRTLATHTALNRKAQAGADYLARRGGLVHSNLRSGMPSCMRGAGENVGYGRSVASVQDAYMRSAGHRANVLNTSWKYVGVGAARAGSRVYTVHVFMNGC